MDDDWDDFSIEELDSIEKTAKQRLAERKVSSNMASSAPATTFYESPSKGRTLPGSLHSSPARPAAGRPLHVKLFRDRPARIGVETQYNPALVAALKTIPGHEWDQGRRVWIFPEDKLEALCVTITSLSTIAIDLEAVPPVSLPKSQYRGDPQGPQFNSSDLQKGMVRMSPVTASPKKRQIVTVQLYPMSSDLIAARNPYHESIKEACQSVSGRAWNTVERVWTFPKTSLHDLVQALKRVDNPALVIEAVPPLALPESSNENLRTEADKGTCRAALWPSSGTLPVAQDPEKPSMKASVKFTFHISGKIAAKFDYDPKLVAVLKSIPGAEWHSRERVWVFPPSSLQEAETKLSNIDGMFVNVEHLEPFVRRALEVSSVMPDLTERYNKIPYELERRLLPFQRDGVKFALQHGGRSLIADEMGLGKTLQAIAFSACFSDIWPVLVITPSSLRLQWATMITQWLNISPSEIVVVMSQCCGSNREGFNIVQSSGRGPRLKGLFNVISYDLVTKLLDEIIQADFKIIIADEAHYIKNAQAKRTAACVPLLQKSQFTLLLTGTPALSRPIELFKQLEALQPGAYKNVHEYGKRYCVGGHFGVYQGSSNCEELHALIKSTVMIRRLKKDVLSELPQKRRQQIFLTLDEKGLRQMRALFYELEAVKRDMSSCTSQEEAENLKYSQRQIISKIYTESAEVKIPAVLDYLSTVIEADCKFLIFAHHKVLLDSIEEFFKKKKLQYIRIDGGTEASSRQRLATRFQESEAVKAAVLGIKAAGVGLTLTAASMVIFAEMTWTPGDLVQAEDRAHRIGQVSSVNVYYLHAHDTIDDLIWDSVQHKLENVGQVLDGKEDALHIAASEHHHSLPPGQSTLKAFLQVPNDTGIGRQYHNSEDNGKSPTSRKSNLKAFLQPCKHSETIICSDSTDSVPKKRKLNPIEGEHTF